MTLSDSNRLFSSKAFEGWKQVRENEQKMAISIIERIDNLTKQVGELAKAMAGR